MKIFNYYNLTFIFILLFFFSSCKEKRLAHIAITKEGKMSWSKKTNCSIIYEDGKDAITLEGKIKLRGGSSSRYDKHSFTIELNDKYPLGRLPEDDDWILNANYIDKTFMRHKISYDLFREMSETNIAPKSSYITLDLNQQYQGLYVLMEKVNKGLIGLDKKDSMAMIFKDPPIFYKDRLSYVKDSLNYYQQKFPKISKADKTSYMDEFKQFLFYSSDEEFAATIEKWVDIESVIDWQLILLLSNNGDGIVKNFFLYKMNASTPFRFAIWDYDHSYGRDGDNELNLIERPINCNRSILLKRLMEIDETTYNIRLTKRYRELRSSGCYSVKNFEKHIEKNNRLIHKEISKNFEKWPVDAKWYYDANHYEQELEILRSFMRKRIKQLDNYFDTL